MTLRQLLLVCFLLDLYSLCFRSLLNNSPARNVRRCRSGLYRLIVTLDQVLVDPPGLLFTRRVVKADVKSRALLTKQRELRQVEFDGEWA